LASPRGRGLSTSSTLTPPATVMAMVVTLAAEARAVLDVAATMAVVKVLHEFGHGLSCKKFGGECHEIGFMLLVFTPCLYCNVSDSWMLPNKWKRVWIGAGGIYVEMILASLAAFVWFFTESGTTVNDLCLNMMFLNVVSTVLVNGNPLLRFDGYYILMDMLEIPNLRQKSTEVLKRWFQKTCLGLELQDDPFSGDVINSYNDGSPEPGADPLGPFYELETSSPAADLEPGKILTHVQTTIHLRGPDDKVNSISEKVLGAGLERIKAAL
jgi:hypothetical protein